ncbi:hypothetical protein [Burkholderia metallica]|uniref:hypothetical protein n=1 Tax=Burkholderia metallica TaxID=488729 RepID=UPI001CF1CB76|nr:hypothetical protein [Burkholderia metallica]MCA8018088.1 hypothetical protein [Burkholderia metallica]
MAKRETQPSRSQSQSQPRTPSGNWNSNGTSQGKQTGAVRQSPDACNDRKERK